jgi:hypothetical protein
MKPTNPKINNMMSMGTLLASVSCTSYRATITHVHDSASWTQAAVPLHPFLIVLCDAYPFTNFKASASVCRPDAESPPVAGTAQWFNRIADTQ